MAYNENESPFVLNVKTVFEISKEFNLLRSKVCKRL